MRVCNYMYSSVGLPLLGYILIDDGIRQVRMLESKYWQASRQNSQRGKKAGTKTTTEEDLKLPYLTDEVDDLPDTINSGIKQVDDVQEKAVQEVMPTGEVVGIVQRFQRDYVACLAQEDEEYISHSIPGRCVFVTFVPHVIWQLQLRRIALNLVKIVKWNLSCHLHGEATK